MAAVAENAVGSDDRQFPHRGTPSSPPPSSPSSDPASDFRKGVRDLVNLLSNLNPSAEEFVPSSKSASPPAAIASAGAKPNGILSPDAPIFVAAGGAEADFGNLKDSGNDVLNNSRRVPSLIPRLSPFDQNRRDVCNYALAVIGDKSATIVSPLVRGVRFHRLILPSVEVEAHGEMMANSSIQSGSQNPPFELELTIFSP